MLVFIMDGALLRKLSNKQEGNVSMIYVASQNKHVFVDLTRFNGGLDDANRRSPQDILRYGKVVLSLLERGWCQQARHHADVDSGADERNQTAAVLG